MLPSSSTLADHADVHVVALAAKGESNGDMSASAKSVSVNDIMRYRDLIRQDGADGLAREAMVARGNLRPASMQRQQSSGTSRSAAAVGGARPKSVTTETHVSIVQRSSSLCICRALARVA